MKTISAPASLRSNKILGTTALVGALAWAGLTAPAFARTDPELPPLLVQETQRELVDAGQLAPAKPKIARAIAAPVVMPGPESARQAPVDLGEVAAQPTNAEQKPAEGLALAAAAMIATAPTAQTTAPSLTQQTPVIAPVDQAQLVPKVAELKVGTAKPVEVAALASAPVQPPAVAAEPIVAQLPAAQPIAAQPIAAQPPAAQPAPVQVAQLVTPPALADAIKSALAHPTLGKLAHDKKLLQGLNAFYAANGPIWVESTGLNANAMHVLDRIAHSDVDGLNPADFNAVLAAARPTADGKATSTDDLAKMEVATSLAVLDFAQEASNGTVVPLSINKLITRRPEALDPLAALKTVSTASDRAAALDGFNPPSPQFAKLKQVLADVRRQGVAAEPPAPPTVSDGPTLKPGMSDPRVAQLRLRLNVASKAGTDLNVFDDEVVAAVKAFQKAEGLKQDGEVAKRTLSALNTVKKPAKLTERELLANLEFWRWMPRDFGRDFVLVNIPDFTADVVRDGEKIHTTKVVVGKPTTQTPLFSGVMQFLIVNPSWNVPESIRIKEFLPEIRRDPQAFFYNHGYEAVRDGQVVDPSTVDWDTEITKVGIRQPPGDDNALGHIKFMFPNQHAVYLHDTSSRSFFARDVRALSHGCVRVDKPLDFAAAVLKDDPTWTAEKVSALYGGPEQRIDLTHRLNVHIGYFTVWVDDKGVVQHRNDIYGYANQVATALEKTKS